MPWQRPSLSVNSQKVPDVRLDRESTGLHESLGQKESHEEARGTHRLDPESEVFNQLLYMQLMLLPFL